MSDIAALVNSLGGMAQKQQLVTRGARDLDLTLAIRSGEVIRARQGWYTTLPEGDPRVRAVRVGGRLAGISALQQRGAWVLGEHPLHVSVRDNASRLRSQRNRFVPLNVRHTRGVILQWDGADVADRGTAMSVGLSDALFRVVLTEELEVAVAVLDWALRTGQLDEIDFEALILSLPEIHRPIRGWVDPNCDSLPESLARTRLRLAGHVVVSQQPVGESERIDLVVDNEIGLEVDGDAYHRDRFERDRDKDLSITIEDLHALRPSARSVFRDWPRVALAIEVALAARSARGSFGNSGSRMGHPLTIPGNRRERARLRAAVPEFPRGQGTGASSRRE